MKKIQTKKETIISHFQVTRIKEIEEYLNRKQDDEGWVDTVKFHASKGHDVLITKAELIYKVAHEVQDTLIGVTTYFYEITPPVDEEFISAYIEKSTYKLIEKQSDFYEDEIKKLDDELNIEKYKTNKTK